jgi:hypothetical protein
MHLHRSDFSEKSDPVAFEETGRQALPKALQRDFRKIAPEALSTGRAVRML